MPFGLGTYYSLFNVFEMPVSTVPLCKDVDLVAVYHRITPYTTYIHTLQRSRDLKPKIANIVLLTLPFRPPISFDSAVVNQN